MMDFVENSRVSIEVAHCLKKIFYHEQGLISSKNEGHILERLTCVQLQKVESRFECCLILSENISVEFQ
jgi:hypothetical protein